MIQDKSNVYKEVYTILSFLSNDLIDKIPNNVIKQIANLSLDSTSDFYIDKEKKLKDQDISEDSKDLISLIYYDYIASEEEKRELLKLWNENAAIYQEQLRKEYRIDDLFQHQGKESLSGESILTSNTAMIEYKKETLFSKIINYIKNIFSK